MTCAASEVPAHLRAPARQALGTSASTSARVAAGALQISVVKDGKICGVISIGDLVKHVISVQSAALDQLERYISGGYTN